MGPNIYGFYYTWKNLCATFCTAYDFKGHAALSSQSAASAWRSSASRARRRWASRRSSACGNKCDIDEDDLLTFFEQDDNTHIIAQHCEDLKDGRAFAEVAKRVSKKKPVVVLKAGRTSQGARAASSHTGALAGNDKIYDDVLRHRRDPREGAGRELLEYARAIPCCRRRRARTWSSSPAPAGSGVLLSDACVDNGLKLMPMPPDLDAAFRKFIPPFGAAGNPVDITGASSEDLPGDRSPGPRGPAHPRADPGYWHTIITPPMVFAQTMVEVIDEMRAKGIQKPIVASLAGDVESRKPPNTCSTTASAAYPYSTEMP